MAGIEAESRRDGDRSDRDTQGPFGFADAAASFKAVADSITQEQIAARLGATIDSVKAVADAAKPAIEAVSGMIVDFRAWLKSLAGHPLVGVIQDAVKQAVAEEVEKRAARK